MHLKGSYAYNGNKWVAFDDEELVFAKAYFVREHNLLGVALDTLAFDECGHGRYPRLGQMHSVLQYPRNPKYQYQQNNPQSINVSGTVFFCFWIAPILVLSYLYYLNGFIHLYRFIRSQFVARQVDAEN